MGLGHKASSQDQSFSQFYNFPLTLNAGLTGNFQQDFRVGAIHRNQWFQANSPIRTTGAFADFNFKLTRSGLNLFSLGFTFLNDQIGNGIFDDQHFLVSLGTTIAIDKYLRHQVSFGVQPGLIRRGFVASGLRFGNQFNQFAQYDPALLSGENFTDGGFAPVIHLGGVWTYRDTRRLTYYAGGSVHNMNRPVFRFSSSTGATSAAAATPLRSTLTAGASYRLTPRLTALPTVVWHNQNFGNEIVFGANVAYQVNSLRQINGYENPDKVTVGVGLFHRLYDSFIPVVSMKYHGLQTAISYDVNVSGLRNYSADGATQRPLAGSLEISLIYSGYYKEVDPQKQMVPCIFF